MNDAKPDKPAKSGKSRFPTKTVILLLVIGALLVGAPYGIGYGIKKALIAAGADDAAVVDTRLRFNGLEGLRIVDNSIMPTVISSNTNAAAIMIGEKAADMIKADNGMQ